MRGSALLRALAASVIAPGWLIVLSYMPGIDDRVPWARLFAYIALGLLIPACLVAALVARVHASSHQLFLRALPLMLRVMVVLFALGCVPWVASLAGIAASLEVAFTGASTYSTAGALVYAGLSLTYLPIAMRRAGGAFDRVPSVAGVLLPSEDYGELWTMVRAISRQSHSRIPRQLVAVLAPSFDVYFSPVKVSGRMLGGLTLTLSLPLCRLLRISEFRAILAHCFATIRDSRADAYRVMAEIFGSAEAKLDRIAHASRSGFVGRLSTAGLLPMRLCLRHILDVIGRRPGLASEDLVRSADEEAAQQEGVPATANALFKTNAFPLHWFILQEKMKLDLKAGVIATDEGDLPASAVYSNLSALFAHFCAQHPITLDFLEQHATGSPRNLRRRLFHLGWSSLDHWPSMTLEPDDPASALITGYERIEHELTQAERAKVE